jgi:hypothetical protein
MPAQQRALLERNSSSCLSSLPMSRHGRVVMQNCTGADGKPDLKKATNLLKVYALDLQMSAAQSNFRRVKELYDKCLAIQSAISHPHTMGIIRESGGKMHMREKSWEAAHTDFFEAFKSYDDAGSAQRCAHLSHDCMSSLLFCNGGVPAAVGDAHMSCACCKHAISRNICINASSHQAPSSNS